MSPYGQTNEPLHTLRIRSILILGRMINIFRRASSYIVSHRDLYPTFLTIFSLHLLFWIFLLSIGEI
ncbi:hypothetical protein CCMA1212_009678 [Trichoderma ghanense]|uniref:Uncharacterized protein n=1 Tax=Trichoderma ghanense TaxID=65468 RepID=A0ABY2GTC4_9HYPO